VLLQESPILKGENAFHNSYIVMKKYSQLKLMNIQNNSENFLVNFWYLNTSLLVGLTFIPECWPLILGIKIFRVIEILVKSLRNFEGT
jgi:hypothetical protein